MRIVLFLICVMLFATAIARVMLGLQTVDVRPPAIAKTVEYAPTPKPTSTMTASQAQEFYHELMVGTPVAYEEPEEESIVVEFADSYDD